MNIGLCLSGGGTRGVFHIGVLSALRELKIYPSVVSGTSAGALVGALFCAGVAPTVILEEAKSVKWYHFLGARIPKNGISDLSIIKQLLQKYISKDEFENLNIALYIASTNMSLGEVTVFNTGPLFQVVMASCAVPFLFEPVIIDQKIYMDGGITMNLPVSPIVPSCDQVIASNLIPIESMAVNKIKGIQQTLTRVLEISINQNTKSQKPLAHKLIETAEICKYKRYDLNNPDALYKLGYKTAMEILG